MDLQFNGKAGENETLRQMFSDQFTQSQWHKTGKSASLRIEVPPVDFTKPFNEYRDAMPQIFDAARVLAKFAGKLQTDGITLP